jgi:hypothetical protein
MECLQPGQLVEVPAFPPLPVLGIPASLTGYVSILPASKRTLSGSAIAPR